MTSAQVVVIGAGPAGLAASLYLDRLGISVVLVDENPAPGGQIWRNAESRANHPDFGFLGSEYRRGADYIDRLRKSSISYIAEGSVWHIEPGWKVHVIRNGERMVAEADFVICATGAQERPFPLEGWTLPGVMTVGAGQTLLKSGGNIPRAPAWLVGSGPLMIFYAYQLLAAGGKIGGMLFTSSHRDAFAAATCLRPSRYQMLQIFKGVKWLARLMKDVGHIEYGVRDIVISGHPHAERVCYKDAAGRSREHFAEAIFLHNGLIPSFHLQASLGCTAEWVPATSTFRTVVDDFGETNLRGFFLAGDVQDIGGAEAALVRGELAARRIAQRLDKSTAAELQGRTRRLRRELATQLSCQKFLGRLYPVSDPMKWASTDTIICRCEAVRIRDIQALSGLEDASLGRIKSFTRMTMGPCQGRQCAYSLAQACSGSRGNIALSPISVRSPIKPISLASLANTSEQPDQLGKTTSVEVSEKR